MRAVTRYAGSPDDEGIPAYADDTSTAEDSATAERFSDPPSLPTDGPDYSDEYGVTAAEVGTPQRLSARLEREESDRLTEDTETGAAGRLVHDDGGDPVGYDSGEHNGLSAEESAVHIIDDTLEDIE